ncbi:MAG: TetR/AcrR family transcriptional regulator [Hydrogenophaga sp.]|nr:TetR/AcrR family transcriptional regulator [Hydrogenophaga sp.]
MTYQLKPKAKASSKPNPRAASAQVQRAKTRSLIIGAAIPIFAQHGPDIPVVDDFVKSAGVSRGTFYNYFETTRELLEAAMAELSDEFIASIVPIVENEPNPVIRLATAARMFYRRATLDPIFRAFLGSVSGVGTLATEHARADLSEAIDRGLIKVTELDLAEAIAFGVMVYALRSSKVDTGGRERAHEVVRAILNGLGVAPRLIDRALKVQLPPRPDVATT